MPTPHPPATTVAVAVVAVLSTACTTPAAGPPDRAGLSELTGLSGHRQHAGNGESGTAPDDGVVGGRPSGATRLVEAKPATGDALRPDRSEPARVAAVAVLELIEAEGLYVLELATSLRHTAPDRGEVEVWVLHGTGASHPHESRYQLRLVDGGAGWVVAGVAAAR